MSDISYSSQLLCNSRAELLRQSVISMQYPSQTIYFDSIFDGVHERAGALFVDGVITPPLLSLRMRLPGLNSPEFSGFTFSSNLSTPGMFMDDNCLFDPGAEDAAQIVEILNQSVDLLDGMSFEPVFKTLVGRPYSLLSAPTDQVKMPEYCLLWQHVDLVNKVFREHTKVRALFFRI